jgi:hypothetical protein
MYIYFWLIKSSLVPSHQFELMWRIVTREYFTILSGSTTSRQEFAVVMELEDLLQP